eukprot:gnl/Spiro4/28181_TR13939_c0_g1_i1.p1 gnl/Spiro4/28181_TR13939_c0_g1~~gnl/Spiro4/28181_TR13939_c0_g1_i1.p1  ORF type:complete len:320 (+),score=65.00 gnl/Spiro4/28181_TR13939_c0_g1_i1:111-962(+)
MATSLPSNVLSIVRHFVLSSPPGELNAVLEDIRRLTNNPPGLDAVLPGILREYNNEQMTPVEVPGTDYKALITQFGELDTTHYLDPRSNEVLSIDHVRQSVIQKERNTAAPHPLANWRDALDSAMRSYVDEHYPETGVASVYAQPNNTFVICICSSRYNISAMWAGRWRSVWTVKLNQGTHTAVLEGQMKTHVHYYEEGNVQQTAEGNKRADLRNVMDPAALANLVRQALNTEETAFQAALEHSHRDLQANTLRSLRRKMPVTGFIDFQRFLLHDLASEITGH